MFVKAENLNKVPELFESAFARFLESKSITLPDCSVPRIDKVLAPNKRDKRLKKTFLKGEFDKLHLDLTVDGIENLYNQLIQDKTIWSKFEYKDKYSKFISEYS